ERARRLREDVEDSVRGRVEEAVLVTRNIAGELVQKATERATKVAIELALGDTGLLEVQHVQKVVAQRGAHRLGRLRRRGRPRRDPAPVHAERSHGIEAV